MEFCPKCGGMILVDGTKVNCGSCGTKIKKKPKIQASEKIEKTETIAVIKEGQDETHPIVDMKCEKCKHHECFFWTMQTRAADESETKFYKCTKCKHTWREYK